MTRNQKYMAALCQLRFERREDRLPPITPHGLRHQMVDDLAHAPSVVLVVPSSTLH